MSKKLLVVYYTWSNGNTKKIAAELAAACNADICAIETATPYPSDYNATVDQAKHEVKIGFEPDVMKTAYNPADYDIIAIGTPVWRYTMTPAVKSFISSNNWTGKTVATFATNAGWLGTTLDGINTACEGSQSVPSLEVKFDSGGGSRQVTSQNDVDVWIENIQQLL